MQEIAPLAAQRAPAPGNWFAIHTRSRFEKQVASQLHSKQFTTFLPLRKEVHRWKDRYQPVELPLFSGYVFVQMSGHPDARVRVLRTPGVVRIVGFGQQDAVVPEEQIEALRRVLGANSVVTRHRYLRVGQRVRIISGTLAGVTGILARVKGADRLVVAVEPIRQAISIELSGYEVLPLG
jgi:transcription antitermination factor NusG